MKKLIIVAILLSSSLWVYSQKNEKEALSSKHSIGIGAGFTTGVGISYRFVPKKLGFQVNVGPTYSNYGDKVDASFGLALLNKFYEGKWCNLYFFASSSLYYHKSLEYVYEYNNGYYNNGHYQTVETQKINSGIGVGWEFNTQKRIVLNIMAGYAQYNNLEKLGPTAEIALYYRFNGRSKLKS